VQEKEGDTWYILLTVIYYTRNTSNVFAKHLHHDMTTEDVLQHSKMERSVLNFLVEAPGSWLVCDKRTSRGGLSSDCTKAPNHQSSLEHAFATAAAAAIPRHQLTCDQHLRPLHSSRLRTHSPSGVW
jgi:hypothetical protein